MPVPRRPTADRPRRARPGLRWLGRALLVALFVIAGLGSGAGAASAHAVLEHTDPAAGAILPARPRLVTLTFGEAVQLPPNAIRVFDPSGAEIDAAAPYHPGSAPATVGVDLRPGVVAGSYTVAWRIISADTHPVSGAFVFSVGHPSATTAPAVHGGSVAVGVVYAIVRASAFAGFAALVGAGALLVLCWPAGPVPRAARRSLGWGWATLLVSSVATLLVQGPYGNGTGLASMFDPGTVAATLQLPLGGALAARLLLLAGYPFYLGALSRTMPTITFAQRVRAGGVGLGLAATTAATWSVSGHAAVGLQPAAALPVDVAHLTAMAIWIGGLATLTGAVLAPTDPRGGAPSAPTGELTRALARFSPVAHGCVAALVLSGGYQAWRQVGSWAALFATSYGRLLDVKLLGVALILAAASWSRRAVVTLRRGSESARPLTWRVLRRSLAVESLGAVLVLALTAMLVDAEPGRTALASAPASGPVHAVVRYDSGGTNGAGALDVRVDPARTGPDTISVLVHGLDNAPREVPELKAALRLPARRLGPLPVVLTRTGTGRYLGTTQIPLPGVWQLALTVRTSDFDETTVTVAVRVS